MPFLNLDQLPTFYPSCCQWCETSESPFKVKQVIWRSRLLGSHPFHHNHCPHLRQVRFTKSLRCTFRSLEWRQSPLSSPGATDPPINPLMLDSHLTSSIFTFCFFADLSWSTPPFKYLISHIGLSLGEKDTTQPHTCVR